jgi:hypothetical protein
LKLIATSVASDCHPGESHGAAWLIDLDAREARQVLDCRDDGNRRPGRDGGLRGIAFDGETVYVAARDELHAFTRDFRRIGAWRNPYLEDCRGISRWERRLFIACAGCDSILAFDLDAKAFDWAMQVVARQSRFQGRRFDPRKDDGPLLLEKLGLGDVHCTTGGMYLTGLKTGGMLLFNGREIQMAVELPPGSRDARPFRDGVLFNDAEAGLLRYSGRSGSEDRAFRVPDAHGGSSPTPVLARGLAVLSDTLVAGGSSPATVSVYDLAANQRVLSVRLDADPRSAINSLAAWPG